MSTARDLPVFVKSSTPCMKITRKTPPSIHSLQMHRLGPCQERSGNAAGEIWWASLGEPQGSGPEYRRPVLIVQSNEFNESAIRTSICAAMTSNMRLADAPGNVRVTRRASGLPQESVVNVSQLITLDKQRLTEKVGRLPAESLRDVEAGIRLVLAL